MGKLKPGTAIMFRPELGGVERPGKVVETRGSVVVVQLAGDPFPVDVMFTTVRRVGLTDVKELRKAAKEKGIPEWEGMNAEQLAEALAGGSKEEKVSEKPKKKKGKKSGDKKSSSKSSSKKADKVKADSGAKTSSKKGSDKKGKKASGKTSKAAKNGDSPYREGSSLDFIFQELKKGGTVEAIAARVAKKHPINVRSSQKDMDAHVQRRTQSRVMRVTRALEADGFKVERKGRGAEAKVKVVV